MNFYDHPHTLLEDRISDWTRGRLFVRKSFIVALALVLIGLGARAFAQPIKLGYAALSAGQVTAWMAFVSLVAWRDNNFCHFQLSA